MIMVDIVLYMDILTIIKRNKNRKDNFKITHDVSALNFCISLNKKKNVLKTLIKHPKEIA